MVGKYEQNIWKSGYQGHEITLLSHTELNQSLRNNTQYQFNLYHPFTLEIAYGFPTQVQLIDGETD
jgi:hypothetical protein